LLGATCLFYFLRVHHFRGQPMRYDWREEELLQSILELLL
jgi:hypothetical protein